jgi:hypothetical protein
LSPAATALLPSGMLDLLDDDEPSSPGSQQFRRAVYDDFPAENDAQSPVSSGRSISIVSSPQESSQHLPFSHYTGENSDRLDPIGSRVDFGSTSSPSAAPAQVSNRRSFLPWLHRGPKAAEESPVLGSLKPGQSQSFPRQTGEEEANSNKRRISFSTSWNMFNRNSAGPDLPDASTTSPPGLASHRLALAIHGKNGSGVLSERDPSGSRPVSIASSELPRPSTDSGSIWGRMPHTSRIWSPEDNPWTSRNASRRPSIHGSPSALKTTLADADDEILDDAELLHASPSQVGVIGTKPSAAKSLSQRLNPAAPSFMGALFRGKPDKERETAREAKDPKDKSRAKARDKEPKEKKPRASLTSGSEAATPSMDDSPSDSRKSRDALSVDSPSVSESHESLNLDQPLSNTPPDALTGLGINHETSGLKKLLRKGSSSKFSLSSVRGLGGKKGPGSVTSSDKNAPAERASFDEGVEDGGGPARGHDSVNASPSIGSIGGGKTPKEKGVSWGARFGMKKKPGKDRESLDMETNDVTATSPSTEEK